MIPKESQLLDVQGSEKVGVPSVKSHFLEKLHTEVHKHGASPQASWRRAGICSVCSPPPEPKGTLFPFTVNMVSERPSCVNSIVAVALDLTFRAVLGSQKAQSSHVPLPHVESSAHCQHPHQSGRPHSTVLIGHIFGTYS